MVGTAQARLCPPYNSKLGGYGSRRSPRRQGGRTYSAASIHSAAPLHSVSRCSERKNPKWPIFATPASAGVTVRISGLVDVNPEHLSSTPRRTPQRPPQTQ